MSRVIYNEDDQWGWIRWAGAAKQAINGKRGQAFLKELEAALLALPEPKLVASTFQTPEGEVCALGAVAKARGLDMSDVYTDDLYGDEIPEVARDRLGVTFTLAWEIMAVNDDGEAGPYMSAWRWTPEQRYEHVLKWVRQHIKAETGPEQQVSAEESKS